MPALDIPLLGLPCPGIDDEPDTVPPDCAWLDAARAEALVRSEASHA